MRKYFARPAQGEWLLNWRQLSSYSFGGMIGSGWLLSASSVAGQAGKLAWVAWVIGGGVMLVIAIVMTELARRWKKDGGLTWWPYMSSGPLVAMITVAAIWLIYALNPASESTAAVELGSQWFHWLYKSSAQDPAQGQLTWPGFGVAAVLAALLIATSLLALRLITAFTVVATAVKIIVPLIVLVLLIRSGIGTGHDYSSSNDSISSVLTAVTSGGVVYTYTGFQAPIDFGGHTRASARGVRLSIIGPIVFGIVLLTLLQVFSAQHRVLGWNGVDYSSGYVHLAAGLGIWHMFLEWLIKIDTIGSPLSCGVVFTTALAFVINSLVGEDLVPAAVGPQREVECRRWVSGKLLVINYVVSLLFLLFLRDWSSQVDESCVIFVFSYAAPSVSLFALILRDLPPGQHAWAKTRQFGLPGVLAPVSFVSMTIILYEADPGVLIISIGLVLAMTAVLVYLRPATWKARKEPEWKDSLKLGLLLIAYLCAVAALCAVRQHWTSGRWPVVFDVTAVLLGFWAFYALVDTSVSYMRSYPPPDSGA